MAATSPPAAEEREIYKYSRVQPDDSGEEPVLTTEIGKWLKKTGGINGI